MTLPKSIQAYHDCEAYFSQAANSPNGILIELESPGQATRFRQKMNMYRTKLRKQSEKVHEPGDPRYGTSIYDAYEVKVAPDNASAVTVKLYATKVLAVKEL